jgi:hypothetical protein
VSAPEEGFAAENPAAVPATGDPVIDDALRGLRDLPSTPLAEHSDRLAQAHEALQAALERSGNEPVSG